MDFQSSDWVHTIEVTHRGGMDMVILEKDADFVNLAENTKDMVIKRVSEGESIKIGKSRMNKLLHGGKHTFEVNMII